MNRLTALLQLSSPSLPVGAYSYSQGLESAIDAGLVHDETSTGAWLQDSLEMVAARYEAPVWLRMFRALRIDDLAALENWNSEFLATRETAELRAETIQMGYSLIRMMKSLDEPFSYPMDPVGYPAAHAWVCTRWDIDETDGLTAYLYGWLENQVMAALKTVPLGQSAGQRLLLKLRQSVDRSIEIAQQMGDDELSTQTPMLAILSSQHETQYSRLFRS